MTRVCIQERELRSLPPVPENLGSEEQAILISRIFSKTRWKFRNGISRRRVTRDKRSKTQQSHLTTTCFDGSVTRDSYISLIDIVSAYKQAHFECACLV